jgi:hypothetical protein
LQPTEQKDDRTPPHGDGEPPRPSSETEKKKRRLPAEEANFLVRDYLKKNPCASIRKVARANGVSVGAVSKTPAWRANMESRKDAKRSVTKIRYHQLTDEILRNLGHKKYEPSTAVVVEELAERRFLESASEEEKERYFAANREKQMELLSLYVAQMRDDGTYHVVADPPGPDG